MALAGQEVTGAREIDHSSLREAPGSRALGRDLWRTSGLDFDYTIVMDNTARQLFEMSAL